MNLVGPEGKPLVDLAHMEPYIYSVVGQDGLLYPITRIIYSQSQMIIQWGDTDIETMRKRLGNYEQ